MKKPSWIRGYVKVLSSTCFPYQKIRLGFAYSFDPTGQFFHYEPLSTSFIRLWRDLSEKIKLYQGDPILSLRFSTTNLVRLTALHAGARTIGIFDRRDYTV